MVSMGRIEVIGFFIALVARATISTAAERRIHANRPELPRDDRPDTCTDDPAEHARIALVAERRRHSERHARRKSGRTGGHAHGGLLAGVQLALADDVTTARWLDERDAARRAASDTRQQRLGHALLAGPEPDRDDRVLLVRDDVAALYRHTEPHRRSRRGRTPAHGRRRRDGRRAARQRDTESHLHGLKAIAAAAAVMDTLTDQMMMGGRGTAGDASGLSFAVRVRGAPLTAAELSSLVAEVDASLAVDGFATIGDVVSAITARPRFYATTLTPFAAIAALIAAVGVYGVLAYAVSQRTHEFGVRLALGAAPRKLLALALRQGLVVVAVGIPAGIVAAAGLSRYLSSMLFGVTALDAATHVAVAVAFAALAITACYLPARRAAYVDPLAILRAG